MFASVSKEWLFPVCVYPFFLHGANCHRRLNLVTQETSPRVYGYGLVCEVGSGLN